MASFCDLSNEIVENIMLWVPADSLVQFKRVNKFWYSLISDFINDPTFVAKHLLITKDQSSASVLSIQPSPHVDHRLITYPLLTIIYDDDDRKNDHFITVTEALSMPLIRNERCKDNNRLNEVYHCDGLILLVNDVGTMVLCNPALKQSMILPQPKNAIFKGAPSCMGFEFDSRNNNYKCVAIWCDGECKVEVYTVGSDSWRETDMSQDITDSIVDTELNEGLYWRGVCYWLVRYVDEEEAFVLLSFNMSNEEFHLIDLPDVEASVHDLIHEDDDIGFYSLHLSLWNDSVVMCLSPERYNILHIFTMDEAGAFSWTKCVQVGPLENECDQLPFWKNDEILLKVRNIELVNLDQHHSIRCKQVVQLVSYNIRTQKLRDVACDLDRNVLNSSVCFYVKSLISIKRR
ncbi:putative F-box protein At3g10430 isoform X2 [Humulus lupulus]|nr:putative F-box protein At3g10430 isoform X2 [Humulus lupulus]